MVISFYVRQDVPNGNHYILHFLLKTMVNKKLSRLAKIQIVLTVVGLIGVTNAGIISIQQASAQNSSQEEDNKALVTAFYNDVYDNHNLSAIDKYMADNFTSAGPGTDRESLKALGRTAIDSFPDVTRSLDNMIAEEDMVAIFISWDGTFTGKDVGGIPANGNPWTAATADLYRISDGQIQEHWQVADYSNFTQAVGISEN